jgi:hypothetical protein
MWATGEASAAPVSYAPPYSAQTYPQMLAAQRHPMYATGYTNLFAISPDNYAKPPSFRSIHKGSTDFAPENDVFTHEELQPGQRFRSAGHGLAPNVFWGKAHHALQPAEPAAAHAHAATDRSAAAKPVAAGAGMKREK